MKELKLKIYLDFLIELLYTFLAEIKKEFKILFNIVFFKEKNHFLRLKKIEN